MTSLVSRTVLKAAREDFPIWASTFITFRWDRASIGINNSSRAIFGHVVNERSGPHTAELWSVPWRTRRPQIVRFLVSANSIKSSTFLFVSGFDKRRNGWRRFLHSSWFISFAPDFWSKLLHWWPHHNWICFIFASPSLSSFIFLCNQRCQVMLNYAPDCHSTNRSLNYCMKLMPMQVINLKLEISIRKISHEIWICKSISSHGRGKTRNIYFLF